MIIFNSIDLSIPDHCMFWAVCNLAYFGFLRSAEFMVPNLVSFSTAPHLHVVDISVDSDSHPDCLQVRIKASKTDPFCKGCFIHIGRGSFPLYALQAVMAILVAHSSYFRMVGQYLMVSLLAGSGRFWHVPEFQGTSPATVFGSERPQWKPVAVSLIQALGCWSSNAYQS